MGTSNSPNRNGRPQPIKRGFFIYLAKQIYQISDFNASEIVLRNVDTGEMTSIDLAELFSKSEKSEAGPVMAPTLQELQDELTKPNPVILEPQSSDLPEVFLKKADAIIRSMETIEGLIREELRRAKLRGGEVPTHTVALKHALEQLDEPFGMTKFYKDLKLYLRCGRDRIAIAWALRPKTYGKSKMSSAQTHFLDTMIVRLYAGSLRIPIAELYNIAKKLLAKRLGIWVDPEKCVNGVPQRLVDELLKESIPLDAIKQNPDNAEILTTIKMPSRSFTFNYVNWFTASPDLGEGVYDSHHGKGAWDKQFRVFDTYIEVAEAPMQYVWADHTLINVFIVEGDEEPVVFRVWLTIFIDAYTRSIVGRSLSVNGPSRDSIQSGLLNVIWPKTCHTEAGIEGDWPIFGIPQILSLDNAWAHHSHSLESLSRYIGQNGKYNEISLDYRPPYKARYGSLVENQIGSIKRYLERLPGAIRSKDHEGIRSAKQEARLRYTDLVYYIDKYIVAYQNKPHSGLDGLTPNQKWTQYVDEHGVNPIPNLTTGLERLFWIEDPDTRVIARGKGINRYNGSYWSKEVSWLPSIGKDGQPIQYTTRHHPDNISILALFQGGTYLGDIYRKEQLQADGTVRPVSEVEMELAKAIAKAKGLPPGKWDDEVDEIAQLSETRRKEQIQAQKKRKKGNGRKKAPTKSDVKKVENALDQADSSTTVNDQFTDLLSGFLGDGDD